MGGGGGGLGHTKVGPGNCSETVFTRDRRILSLMTSPRRPQRPLWVLCRSSVRGLCGTGESRVCVIKLVGRSEPWPPSPSLLSAGFREATRTSLRAVASPPRSASPLVTSFPPLAEEGQALSPAVECHFVVVWAQPSLSVTAASSLQPAQQWGSRQVGGIPLSAHLLLLRGGGPDRTARPRPTGAGELAGCSRTPARRGRKCTGGGAGAL